MSGRRWLPNSTQMPNYFLDFLCQDLTESELRVALYILRRTYGFQKEGDAIALSQLVDGIKRRDGTLLDRGTGLSKTSVLRGVKGLEARGMLVAHRTPGTKRSAPETTFYVLAIESLDSADGAIIEGSTKSALPQSQIYTNGSADRIAEVVPNLHLQNPDQNQETKGYYFAQRMKELRRQHPAGGDNFDVRLAAALLADPDPAKMLARMESVVAEAKKKASR